jgi:hypothetical protein
MDDKQFILLEQYILALQADSSVPIPTDLDPKLAKMAQHLVAYSQITTDATTKKRIWGAVLSEFESSIQTEETNNMVNVQSNHQKNTSTLLMWIAVLAIIVLLGSAIATIGNNRPTPPQLGAGVNLSQGEATPSIAPTLIMPTPITQALITPTLIIPVIDTPPEGYIPVVTFYVPVTWGTVIREDMLTVVYWKADRAPSGSFMRMEDVVGKIAIADISRFMPVLDVMVVDEIIGMTQVPNITPTRMMLTATPISPTPTPTTSPPRPPRP